MRTFGALRLRLSAVNHISSWSRIRTAYRKSNKWGYIFILPLVADFLIFTLYMVGFSFWLSFQELSAGVYTFVGLQNFERMLRSPATWNALGNTLIYTSIVVSAGLFIALVLSELIFRRSSRVQIFFKGAFYLPAVVSTIVISLVWYWIFNPFYGILNAVIGLIGFPPQNWLMNPNLALPSIIFMTIVSSGGPAIILLTAAIGGIPNELWDASRIDGAGDWTRFWRITVPLLRPTLLYLFVVGFIGNFQVFEQIYILTSGGPGFPGATETVGFLIYDSAFRAMQFGQAAALSLLLFVLILVFSIVQFRIFASELEY
jgi:multiple sugar transport system permease protein